MSTDHAMLSIEKQAGNLVRLADELGLNLTIHLEPLKPLAMGNNRPVVTVWPIKSGDGPTMVRTMPRHVEPAVAPGKLRDVRALLFEALAALEPATNVTLRADIEATLGVMSPLKANTIAFTHPVSDRQADELRTAWKEVGPAAFGFGTIIERAQESSAPPEERDAHRGGNSYEASMLRNLLALIHGDGGHYLEEHGLEKALADAEIKVLEPRAASAPELPADTLVLQAQLSTAYKLLNAVLDSNLATHLGGGPGSTLYDEIAAALPASYSCSSHVERTP